MTTDGLLAVRGRSRPARFETSGAAAWTAAADAPRRRGALIGRCAAWRPAATGASAVQRVRLLAALAWRGPASVGNVARPRLRGLGRVLGGRCAAPWRSTALGAGGEGFERRSRGLARPRLDAASAVGELEQLRDGVPVAGGAVAAQALAELAGELGLLDPVRVPGVGLAADRPRSARRRSPAASSAATRSASGSPEKNVTWKSFGVDGPSGIGLRSITPGQLVARADDGRGTRRRTRRAPARDLALERLRLLRSRSARCCRSARACATSS